MAVDAKQELILARGEMEFDAAFGRWLTENPGIAAQGEKLVKPMRAYLHQFFLMGVMSKVASEAVEDAASYGVEQVLKEIANIQQPDGVH